MCNPPVVPSDSDSYSKLSLSLVLVVVLTFLKTICDEVGRALVRAENLSYNLCVRCVDTADVVVLGKHSDTV